MKSNFGFSNYIHCKFIVEINVVVFFLYDIGVVVRIEEDKFDVLKNSMWSWFDLFDIFLDRLHIMQFSAKINDLMSYYYKPMSKII